MDLLPALLTLLLHLCRSPAAGGSKGAGRIVV
jgi:hypothetical protein